jgi:hypothetical protein
MKRRRNMTEAAVLQEIHSGQGEHELADIR